MTLTELASRDRTRAAQRRAAAVRKLTETLELASTQQRGRRLPLRPAWSESLLAGGRHRLAY